MGYVSKIQVIERKNDTRQFYLICPAPLAEALELTKVEAMGDPESEKVTRRRQKARARAARERVQCLSYQDQVLSEDEEGAGHIAQSRES